MKKIILAFNILIWCNFSASAQEDIPTLVKSFCFSSEIKNDKLEKIQQQKDVMQVAKVIHEVALDTNFMNFENTIYLIRKFQQNSLSNAPLQESLTSSLSEIATSNKKLASSAMKAMRFFKRQDFSADTKENILQVISFNDLARIEAIEMIGFIGNTEDIFYLKGIGSFISLGKKEKYKILLALVRLGDPESINEYVNEISQRTINDQLVYSILSDMLYTRNKQVFDFLLLDTQHSNTLCYSANNDSQEKIHCAYRILEEISPFILNFPIQVDLSGSIVGDYEMALEKVRNWVVESRLEYSINTQIF